MGDGVAKPAVARAAFTAGLNGVAAKVGNGSGRSPSLVGAMVPMECVSRKISTAVFTSGALASFFLPPAAAPPDSAFFFFLFFFFFAFLVDGAGAAGVSPPRERDRVRGRVRSTWVWKGGGGPGFVQITPPLRHRYATATPHATANFPLSPLSNASPLFFTTVFFNARIASSVNKTRGTDGDASRSWSLSEAALGDSFCPLGRPRRVNFCLQSDFCLAPCRSCRLN